MSSGRFDCTTNKAEAVLVYVEAGANSGEYLIYFMNGNTKTYIIMEDKAAGGKFTTDKASATVFEWDAKINTMVVLEDSNNRAFGAQATSTYENFSSYDASNAYNWAQFVE